MRWLTQQQPPQQRSFSQRTTTGSLLDRHQRHHRNFDASSGRILSKPSIDSSSLPAAASSFLYQDSSSNIYLQAITNTTSSFPSPASQKLLANFSALTLQAPALSSYYAESPAVVQDATTGLLVPKTILLAQNYLKQWRHSFFARFLLLDVETQVLSPLDPNSTTTSDMNPLWSPDGQLVVIYFLQFPIFSWFVFFFVSLSAFLFFFYLGDLPLFHHLITYYHRLLCETTIFCSRTYRVLNLRLRLPLTVPRRELPTGPS